MPGSSTVNFRVTSGTRAGATSRCTSVFVPSGATSYSFANSTSRSAASERVQNSSDAADRLVLFAKLYDVAPDGTKTLVHRLVAPARVPDVTRKFTVELPGIVHRY